MCSPHYVGSISQINENKIVCVPTFISSSFESHLPFLCTKLLLPRRETGTLSYLLQLVLVLINHSLMKKEELFYVVCVL